MDASVTPARVDGRRSRGRGHHSCGIRRGFARRRRRRPAGCHRRAGFRSVTPDIRLRAVAVSPDAVGSADCAFHRGACDRPGRRGRDRCRCGSPPGSFRTHARIAGRRRGGGDVRAGSRSRHRPAVDQAGRPSRTGRHGRSARRGRTVLAGVVARHGCGTCVRVPRAADA